MIQYVIRRLLLLIPMLLVLTFFAFTLMELNPSDPAAVVLRAQQIPITEQSLTLMRKDLGLDLPFMTRYGNWLKDLCQFNLGHSYYKKNLLVADEIAWRFPNTIRLALTSFGILIGTSLPIGVLCGIFPDSRFDRIVRSIVFALTAIPGFWLAIILMYFLSVKLNWLPLSGMRENNAIVLPALTMALPSMATYIRLLRSAMIETMSSPHVLYARSRGLSEGKIVLKHGFMNSIQTTLTAMGMGLASFIGGSFVVETIFAWPGIGQLAVESVFSRDFPMIQVYILLMGLIFIGINLVVDILQMVLNPRLRSETL